MICCGHRGLCTRTWCDDHHVEPGGLRVDRPPGGHHGRGAVALPAGRM